MKTVIAILVCLAIFFYIFVDVYEYQVKVIYCDSRPSKIISVQNTTMSQNSDIKTYKQAVPKFEGELNVCEIKVISTRKIKKLF
jgi:hypothetical protein